MLDVAKARKTLGMALGMCPKNKLYKGYIELELQVIKYCSKTFINRGLIPNSFASLIAAERYTKSTCYIAQNIALHGSRLQSWSVCSEMWNVAELYSSLQFRRHYWTCQKCCGKHILVRVTLLIVLLCFEPFIKTLNAGKRNGPSAAHCMSDYSRGQSMSRSG
jgi:hypothetical protein